MSRGVSVLCGGRCVYSVSHSMERGRRDLHFLLGVMFTSVLIGAGAMSLHK